MNPLRLSRPSGDPKINIDSTELPLSIIPSRQSLRLETEERGVYGVCLFYCLILGRRRRDLDKRKNSDKIPFEPVKNNK
jgi:hypothetical protein